jgi:F-box and WD-40 domain protein CDC4
MLEHFDQLNDKAKMHVFTHMLRRSKLPILQQVAELASSVLKRDFVSDLPYEITVQMLKYLDTRSLARASMVSKKWARTVNHDRGLWVKRLVAEDLYLGHGVEEEEERTIQRRMALIQKHNLPTSGLEWPNPMKHVFRRRFTSANNWLKSKPEIVAFPAIGSPASIMTGTHITQGKIVAARDRKVLHVYDAQTGQLLRRLRGHTAGIWASDVHENRLVTGSTDRSLRVWDLNTGNAHIFRGHTSTVRCAKIVLPVWYEEEQCFQPPCPLVVSGSRDGTLRVWRIPEAGEAYYNDYVSASSSLFR